MIQEFKPGDKVTYDNGFKIEKGIVKSLSDDYHVFIVYHWNNEPEKYMNYTAARTRKADIVKGWDHGN